MKMLSSRQAVEYEQDGVCFPIHALDPGEVLRFKSAFEELEEFLGGRPDPMRLRHLHLHFSWARELALHPRILDAVEDIIGPDILVHSSTMFCKHPGDGAFVSWHQDGYYWELSEPRLVSAWIALADSTSENGCMRVVRGSHRTGNLPHSESARSEQNMLTSGLEIAVAVEESQATDVLLRAGEISLHNVNIVHGSNPNRSKTTRIGFAVRYIAPEIGQRLPHQPVLLARGDNKGGNFDLYPAPAAASLREAVAAQEKFSQLVQRNRERKPA